VIVASGGTPAALAAKSATSIIPVVFVTDDPVERGLVASLARPDGNLTGVSLLGVELMGKRLELLVELVPEVKVITLLVNPATPVTERLVQDAQEAARTKEVRLVAAGVGLQSPAAAGVGSATAFPRWRRARYRG
jgi:putative tryptophan/tyrosine transport system substrate-binding protein